MIRDPSVRRWWGTLETDEEIREDLRNEGTAFTIEHDGELAGWLGVWDEPTPDYRHAGLDISLLPEFQGRGLGTGRAAPGHPLADRRARASPRHDRPVAGEHARDPRLRVGGVSARRRHAPGRARPGRLLARRTAHGSPGRRDHLNNMKSTHERRQTCTRGTVPRHLLLLLAVLGAMLTVPAAAAHAANPPIKHIWVVVLENKSYDETFGGGGRAPTSPATSRSMGCSTRSSTGSPTSRWATTSRWSAARAPTPRPRPTASSTTRWSPARSAPTGSPWGTGCVFPSSVKSVGDQLTSKGLGWKAYMQDMGTPCRHPAMFSAGQDAERPDRATSTPRGTTRSSTSRRSPARRSAPSTTSDFSALSGDLASAARTPNFSLIVPNLCEDGARRALRRQAARRPADRRRLPAQVDPR